LINNIKKFILKNKIYLTLLLIITLIIYRSPYILINGRFFAEDAQIFFKNTYEKGFIYGLFQIYLETGYLNLWANIVSVFANITPIKYAPFWSIYLSLLLKLFIFFFIFFSKSDFLINYKHKAIASFIILFSPPMVPEIWLNAINGMSYFGIFAIIFLFSNHSKSLFFRFSFMTMFIGSLSSLYVCVLTPVYYFKYYLTKKKVDKNRFYFIFLGTLIQLFIFSYTHINSLQWKDTRFIVSYEKIINFFYNVVSKDFFGRQISKKLYENFISDNSIIFLFIFIFFLTLFFLFLNYQIRIKKDKILLKLVLIFFLESLLVIFGAQGETVYGRYAAVPGISLLFIILRLSQTSSRSINKFFTLSLIFSCLMGLIEFRYMARYPKQLNCINCPDWKEQILIWEKNYNYKILVWDYPLKYFYLKKNN